MSDLVRKFPNSLIGRKTALMRLQLYCNGIPPAMLMLPQDVKDYFAQPDLPFLSALRTMQAKEATMSGNLERKNHALEILKIYTISFISALKYAVKRSVMAKDGKWEARYLAYYNLDETGGRIPLLNTEGKILIWTRSMLNGEQQRLARYPTAVPMSNPSAAELQQMLDTVNEQISILSASQSQSTAARREFLKLLKPTDNMLRKTWAYLEAQNQHLPMETKREALRNAGVIYYNTGKSTTLSVVVKDAAGKPLQGARATLVQTGAGTTANKEGRINLKTKTDGEVQMEISYPAKQSATVSFNITKADAGTTITAAEVVMG